jgi:cytochrome c553
MKVHKGLWIIAGFFATHALAGDFSQAQKIVSTTCAACHNPDGNSTAPENPKLAGQVSEYIERQLKNFKAGVRVNPVMQGMAASLSDEDIKQLAGFFSEQSPKPKTSKDPEKVELGKLIYRGGVAKSGVPACMACHGPAGAGIPAQYPRLAGQHAPYVVAQLKSFKTSARGGHKDDGLGKIMVEVAGKLTDDEINAVAEYVSALR